LSHEGLLNCNFHNYNQSQTYERIYHEQALKQNEIIRQPC
jgi:hypothetical protein